MLVKTFLLGKGILRKNLGVSFNKAEVAKLVNARV